MAFTTTTSSDIPAIQTQMPVPTTSDPTPTTSDPSTPPFSIVSVGEATLAQKSITMTAAWSVKKSAICERAKELGLRLVVRELVEQSEKEQETVVMILGGVEKDVNLFCGWLREQASLTGGQVEVSDYDQQVFDRTLIRKTADQRVIRQQSSGWDDENFELQEPIEATQEPPSYADITGMTTLVQSINNPAVVGETTKFVINGTLAATGLSVYNDVLTSGVNMVSKTREVAYEAQQEGQLVRRPAAGSPFDQMRELHRFYEWEKSQSVVPNSPLSPASAAADAQALRQKATETVTRPGKSRKEIAEEEAAIEYVRKLRAEADAAESRKVEEARTADEVYRKAKAERVYAELKVEMARLKIEKAKAKRDS